jgi:predicted molibdopterin-dependent oxidoreductase YjgC
MFRRIKEPEEVGLTFTFNGDPVEARAGDTVASALLLSGVKAFRRAPVSGAERGPFCLMGTCFDCLVEIDGIPNRQACMTKAKEGMAVCRPKQATGEETS